jgi:CubicO group peptidase (beta-lactamase class C family)
MTPVIALPRTAPEIQGVRATAILAFLDAVEQSGLALHSVMLLRHGAIVAEGWWAPYAAERPHMLFSLSKSFASTAVGLAVAEGRLTVDDLVLPFFPEDAPADVSTYLAALRVRDLLTMTSGHADDTTAGFFERPDGNWVASFLEQPLSYAPGTHFKYNSGCTYMLSAIVQRLTGQTVLEYLRPRLLDPLGIEHATWESCPRGVNVGGWGLSITTESIARFGQLYLQHGRWRDEQLLPQEWVAAATRKQVPNGPDPAVDWEQGYGYQFWRSRHNTYRGDGAFGQFCIVMPEKDAVLAITSGVGNMQAVLDLVWRHLVPGLTNAELPPSDDAQRLAERLTMLMLPQPEGGTSALEPTVSGRTYDFPTNPNKIERLSLEFDADVVLRVRDDRGEHRVVAGRGAWVEGETTLDEHGPFRVAATGAWTAPDTYELRLAYVETPFCPTITCRFEDDRVRVAYRLNVSFGPTELPPIEGQLSEGKARA